MKVVSLIGADYGKVIDLPFAAAQSCIASGTHCEPGQEPKRRTQGRPAISTNIGELDETTHGVAKPPQLPGDQEPVGEPLKVDTTDVGEYLNGDFPPLVNLNALEYQAGKESGWVDDTSGDDVIIITLANYVAAYEIRRRLPDGGVVAELVKDSVRRSVEIPPDWEELHAATRRKLARLITGAPVKTTEDAVMIIRGYMK